MKGLISFIVGVLFAIGLGISGMTQPHIVKGFLDIFGNWNLSLMMVMVGAIGIHAIAYALIRKRRTPLFSNIFEIPNNKTIDFKLIAGAILFGLGWGWAGICPGPGIVSILSGEMKIMYFMMAMLAGMKLFQMISKKFP